MRRFRDDEVCQLLTDFPRETLTALLLDRLFHLSVTLSTRHEFEIFCTLLTRHETKLEMKEKKKTESGKGYPKFFSFLENVL